MAPADAYKCPPDADGNKGAQGMRYADSIVCNVRYYRLTAYMWLNSSGFGMRSGIKRPMLSRRPTMRSVLQLPRIMRQRDYRASIVGICHSVCFASKLLI